jgi:uncharacterized protein
MYQRSLVAELVSAMQREPALVHVIVGPRQVGKTTAADQIAAELDWPVHMASADAPRPHLPEWIDMQWQIADRLTTDGPVLLILDEVQKVPGWSEVVKALWDARRRTASKVRPLLLGSSALLVQKGLSESLAGRFFLHRAAHWSWSETRAAFGFDLDEWLYFGGYPGAAPLVTSIDSWKRYVTDSLIETVIARDVLQLQTVNKPALLRHLFGVASGYPAQIVSYTKMLGQLHDAGNTTTLAHYLTLLETAFLVSGIQLFARGVVRKRSSSPKLVLWNNALVTASSLATFEMARRDGELWGRLVENAVGAHLLGDLHGPSWDVTYWRDGGDEVDYVVSHGENVWALEVKSARPRKSRGLALFCKRYPKARPLVIGGQGIPLTEFFSKPARAWLV